MTVNYDLILVNALIDLESSGANRGFQLGLVYIATYVQEHGYNTKIVTGVNVVTKLYNLINNTPLPLVGFYVTADNVQEVERACIALKNLFPEIKIILGGPEARVDNERLLKNNICKYVCAGDGEECTLQLLNFLNNKSEVKIFEISNLIFVDSQTQKVIKNPSYNLPFNLDHYPIPKRELYDSNYLDAGHIATARGCASECTFCFEGIDKKIRRHSVSRVIEEMLYLKNKFGTSYFSFVDDTFTTDRKKIYSLCEQLKIHFQPLKNMAWYCEAKVSDICKDPKIVDTMVDAGLIRMQFGTESGSQRIIDAYKKEITIEQIYKSVEVASKTKITSMFTNYIIGGAHETIETYNKTLSMALDLMRLAPGVLECSYTFLSPYNGTDIRKNPSKYEIEILDSEFVTAPSDSYVFAHSKHLSRLQLMEMGQEFHFSIANVMAELIPKLSVESIKDHFVYSNFGMSTTWYTFLNKDPFFRKWGVNIQSGHETRATCNRTDLLQLIPCRSFELEKIQNGQLTWGLRSKNFFFEGYELFLAEFASGKLTLHEIAERAVSHFRFNISKDQIIIDLVEFYNHLSDEFLVTFRRFS